MKNPIYFITCVLLISFSMNAQKKAIAFEVIKNSNSLEWVCTNNTNITQKITLILKKHEGLKGYKNPVTLLVKPKSKQLFLNVSFNGAYNYNWSYTFISAMTKQEKDAIVVSKEAFMLKDFSKINEGIVIFDKIECPRCNRALAFLLDNNIAFKSVDVSKGKKLNNHKMWEILNENGITEVISTPVFLVNGELSHSHKNLGAFLESLKE